jgi:vacuolar-type H+-ATPase subunit D/Vma8
MGSDLYMEARNSPQPIPKASELVKLLEDERDTLRERFAAVVAEKSRLEAQARQDADTIVRLTRERDGALRDGADGTDVN